MPNCFAHSADQRDINHNCLPMGAQPTQAYKCTKPPLGPYFKRRGSWYKMRKSRIYTP